MDNNTATEHRQCSYGREEQSNLGFLEMLWAEHFESLAVGSLLCIVEVAEH